MVMTKADEEGIYTCLASNNAGFDSKEFPVTFVGGSLISVFCNDASEVKKLFPLIAQMSVMRFCTF